MTCKNCFNYETCKRYEKLFHKHITSLKKANEDCEDFEDRSLWIKLPCKVGDTLYEPTDRGTISEYEVLAVRVELFSTFVEWKIKEGIVWRYVHEINSNEIGRTVFLTREEAERALSSMKAKKENK